MNIFQKFIKNYGQMKTANDKQIKEFILSNWDNNYKIVELSKNAFVSNASISRYIKKMRLHSYKDFMRQKKFSRQYLGEEKEYGQVYKSIVDKKKLLLDETLANIDMDLLIKAGELVTTSETVYIVGMGYSRVQAEAMCMRLNRIGKKAIYIDSMQELPFVEEKLSDTRSVCIAISQTGDTSSVNNLCKHFNEVNVKTISIICECKSELATVSDIALCVPKIYSGMYLETVYSEVTVNAVLDFLYSHNLFENYEASIENYNQSTKYY